MFGICSWNGGGALHWRQWVDGSGMQAECRQHGSRQAVQVT